MEWGFFLKKKKSSTINPGAIKVKREMREKNENENEKGSRKNK